MGPFASAPMVPISSLIDIYGLYVTVFELFSWLQKPFRPLRPPARPPRIRCQYRSRRYSFVERQKLDAANDFECQCQDVDVVRF